MLDIKRIRQNPEELKEALQKRNSPIDISELLSMDEKRREEKTEIRQKQPAITILKFSLNQVRYI